MKKLPKIVVVLGPTASGKTDLGIFLAKKFNGEIISADSRQVYRGMDVGTAKPWGVWKKVDGIAAVASLPRNDTATVDSRFRGNDNLAYITDGVPHYLIDIIEPDEEFSLADFKKMAEEKIEDILKRGKLPIIVGGTGLYIWAIVDNLDIPAVAPDKELRARLEEKSLDELVVDLKKIDPKTAGRIDLKNPRRVLRALEVCLGTGSSFFEQRKKGAPRYEALQIGLNWPREELYERIGRRVDMMMGGGLVEEVRKLSEMLDSRRSLPRTAIRGGNDRQATVDSRFRGNDSKTEILKRACPVPRYGVQDDNKNMGLPRPFAGARNDIWKLPSMSGIGYKQVGYYLRGEMTSPEAVETLKKDTRHYAKRQVTWFKKDKRINWVERVNLEMAMKLVEDFIG